MCNEFMEIDGVIDWVQVVMEEACIGVCEDPLELLLEDRVVDVGLILRLCEEFEKRSCLADLLLVVEKMRLLITHHDAGHVAEVIAGIGIITDEGHPAFSEFLSTHGQQFVAYLRRHPGIEPMRHNVIETTQIGRGLPKVELVERDVLDPQLLDSGFTLRNG